MGLFIRTRLETRRLPPPPQLLPTIPLQARDPLLVGGMCACGGWGGQVVVRKMEGGGNIAPPGPRRRKRQLEQLAREPLACLWFFLFFSTTPYPQPIPATPKRLSYPSPTPAGASAVWRGLRFQDLRKQLLAREKARGTRMGETGFLIASGFRGP